MNVHWTESALTDLRAEAADSQERGNMEIECLGIRRKCHRQFLRERQHLRFWLFVLSLLCERGREAKQNGCDDRYAREHTAAPHGSFSTLAYLA